MAKKNNPMGAAKLSFSADIGQFLTDNRIRLLDAIGEYGSLSAAARSLPMSYKAAWDAVNAMNNISDKELVIRSTGGRNGGGTQLTPYAKKLINMYRAMEVEYQRSLERLHQAMADSSEAMDINDFRRLMTRLHFNSSARNQLLGVVSSITIGAVSVIVELKVGDRLHISAAIPKEAAESLDIQYGQELLAVVNSSQMILHANETFKLSADNQLKGIVRHIHPGAVCSDINVELSDQKSLDITITEESCAELGLVIGQPIIVSFNASSVILCRYE
ncbi:TOBE domain-containing protein [Reinekea marinisedimentorum]|uniref:Molybdate transport system regulatory protein n=1 Tax=Reinekea marinisedimentorum TaxID=230495 RepID=A0A4R3I824_9GAMM|nr:TOBE domain-containing protein [Reinekea marinisedimentorum]TCS40317.1 molybdate transport system regulatory protein [Reinekea marinisedimentorum]